MILTVSQLFPEYRIIRVPLYELFYGDGGFFIFIDHFPRFYNYFLLKKLIKYVMCIIVHSTGVFLGYYFLHKYEVYHFNYLHLKFDLIWTDRQHYTALEIG